MSHRGRSQADDAMVAALATGLSVLDVAAQVGVSPQTVHRRLKDAAFKSRVEQARREVIQQATDRLASSMTSAADTLTELLQAKRESVRLGAARAILELGTRLRESMEIVERLAALEQQLDAIETRPTTPLEPTP